MMGFIDQATGFLKIILMTSSTVIVSFFLALWFMPMYYLIRKLKSRESFCRYDVIGVICPAIVLLELFGKNPQLEYPYNWLAATLAIILGKFYYAFWRKHSD